MIIKHVLEECEVAADLSLEKVFIFSGFELLIELLRFCWAFVELAGKRNHQALS